MKQANASRGLYALVAVVVAGCGVEEAPVARGDADELGWIEGTIDPGRAIVAYRTSHTPEELATLPFREQALSPITEEKNRVIGSNNTANTVEFIVECNGTPTCSAPFAAARPMTGMLL